MNTTYELYGAPTGNCIRAAIALEEAGLPYTVRSVDLANGEHRSAAYLALNPAGKVPVLVESQENGPPVVITQSNAIILYAAERAPGRLLPDDSLARSVVYERFFFFVTDVIAVSHAAFFLRSAGVPAGQAGLRRERAVEERRPRARYRAGLVQARRRVVQIHSTGQRRA